MLKKLRSEGIAKFIAYEMSLRSTRFNYREVFDITHNELNESDDLKILDCSDESSPGKFSFDELGNPAFYELDRAQTMDIYMVDV